MTYRNYKLIIISFLITASSLQAIHKFVSGFCVGAGTVGLIAARYRSINQRDAERLSWLDSLHSDYAQVIADCDPYLVVQKMIKGNVLWTEHIMLQLQQAASVQPGSSFQSKVTFSVMVTEGELREALYYYQQMFLDKSYGFNSFAMYCREYGYDRSGRSAQDWIAEMTMYFRVYLPSSKNFDICGNESLYFTEENKPGDYSHPYLLGREDLSPSPNYQIWGVPWYARYRMDRYKNIELRDNQGHVDIRVDITEIAPRSGHYKIDLTFECSRIVPEPVVPHPGMPRYNV